MNNKNELLLESLTQYFKDEKKIFFGYYGIMNIIYLYV